MGSFSVTGYNRAVNDYGQSSADFPYITFTISWDTGSTVFTIKASKPSSNYEFDTTGDPWTGYIWWGDFATVYNKWDNGQAVAGYEINQWSIYPDSSRDAKTYTTTISLGKVPTNTEYVGFSCKGASNAETDGLGYLTGWVREGTVSGTWNPLKTITVKEVKKTTSGAVFDYDYYPVEMHSSWSADQLRPPSQHQHTGYEYNSCTSVNDIQTDTTLYLIYMPLTYRATFSANTTSTTHAINIPATQYIEFEGTVPPSGNDSIPSKYCTVTLNAMGGTVSESTLTTYAQFDVWRANINGTNTRVAAGSKWVWTSNLAFTALWKAMSPVILPTPAKLGYTFVTWGVTETATTGYAAGSFTPDGDIELYAIYKPSGIVQIYTGSAFHNYLVWLYYGDGGGPNSDGWHHMMPKLYCTKNGVTKYYNIGGADTGASGGVAMPAITSQPQSITVTAGNVASFSVSASGSNLTYQWQYRTSVNNPWTDCTAVGYNSPTYTFTAEDSFDGRQYRCAVSNSAGTATSEIVSLSVISLPSITTQPSSTTVTAGGTASFSVVASGSNLTYQWYIATSSNSDWIAIPNATSASYSFTTSTSNNGSLFYCKVQNLNGSIDSNTVTLNITSSISATITVQYPSGATCSASNGDLTLQPSSTSGNSCTFIITSAGNWVFSATDGTDTASQVLKITSSTSQTVTLNYSSVPTTISASVIVYCYGGATSCVITKGSSTVNPTQSSGGTMFRFNITSPGEWTITATDGTVTGTKNVVVTSGDTLQIEVGYGSSGGGDESAPNITTQPVSATIAVGQNVTFTIAATGDGVSYQWYYRVSSGSSWQTVANATSTSLSVTGSTDNNGYQYRCIVTNTFGTAASSAATLTTISAPVIATHPSSLSTVIGNTASFYVVASGTDLSYQWYYRTSSSGSWAEVTAASGKTSNYTLTVADRHDGYQYRCGVTNLAGTVYSNVATLTIIRAPTITTQPTSQTVAVDSLATFTIVANGEGLSYQWYHRASSSESWYAISTGTSASYSITAAAGNNGYQYYCKVSNIAGSVDSSTVTLTSVSPPTITAHPTSRTVAADSNVSFSVTANGTGLSYQWQSRTSSSGSWSNISGATSRTYSATVPSSYNGYQYRCRVINIAGTVNSNAATLTVATTPVITTQPTAQSVGESSSATFTVVASGVGLSYQWYYSTTAAGTRTAISDATSATYTFAVTTSDNGKYYCCNVSNIAGNIYSNAVKLTVIAKPTITSHPSSTSVTSGSTATFYVSASGTSLEYLWQYRTSSSGNWTNISSATSYYYSVTASSSNNGYQYRCRVKNAGGTVYSNAATLTIKVVISATVAVGHAKYAIVNGAYQVVGASDCRMTKSGSATLYPMSAYSNEVVSNFQVTEAGTWTISATGFVSQSVTVKNGDALEVTLTGT